MVACVRTLFIVAASVASASTICCAGPNPSRGQTTVAGARKGDSDRRLGIESRLRRAYREMASAEVDQLLDLYEPDAVIQSAGQAPIAGISAIRAFWIATFERYRVELEPEIVEVTEFGDVGIVRGRATGRLVPRAGGDPIELDTWFMQVYRRHSDGIWHFWRGTNGPNPAPSSASQ